MPTTIEPQHKVRPASRQHRLGRRSALTPPHRTDPRPELWHARATENAHHHDLLHPAARPATHRHPDLPHVAQATWVSGSLGQGRIGVRPCWPLKTGLSRRATMVTHGKSPATVLTH